MPLTIVLVEDELATLTHLQFMVLKWNEQAQVYAVDSFEKSVDILQKITPDVLLLDINLQGQNGFDVLSYVNQEQTKVIFVTAEQEYAIQAFEVEAQDYLLKPVSMSRLSKALDKVVRLSESDTPVPVQVHEPTKSNALNLEDRIFVQRNKEAFFIQLKDICSIQSDDYYTYLQDKLGRRFLYRKSLKEWSETLPADNFMQIHRSVIVNLNYVKRFVHNASGGFDVQIVGLETLLPMSRRYKKVFLDQFEDRLKA